MANQELHICRISDAYYCFKKNAFLKESSISFALTDIRQKLEIHSILKVKGKIL